MSTSASDTIPTYSPPTFLRRFMPDPAPFRELRTAEAEQFFIVAVEQLYAQFTRPVPPSRATAHTCLFLTSGTARLSIGPETYVVGPRQVLIVRAGQVYSFAPGDENTGFLCHFHDDLLLHSEAAEKPGGFGFLRLWGRPLITLDVPTAGFAEALLRRLLTEYAAHGRQYPDLLRAYLLALLHELNRAYAALPAPAPSTARSITNRFQQLLATSLTTLHSVSEYAAQLHITPNHLTKAVRAVTGKPAAKWIEETIVLEAKVLLAQSTQSVSEVAAAVGVLDPSYFSRLFKKHAGLTPRAFRQRLGES